VATVLHSSTQCGGGGVLMTGQPGIFEPHGDGVGGTDGIFLL
jgi:hypothetical protein